MAKLSSQRKENILEKLGGLPGWMTRILGKSQLAHARKGRALPAFHQVAGQKRNWLPAMLRLGQYTEGRQAAILFAKARKLKKAGGDPAEVKKLIEKANWTVGLGHSTAIKHREVAKKLKYLRIPELKG